MQSFFVLLAIVASLFSATIAFAPSQIISRTPTRSSTIVMDGKTRVLRDRIKSVKNTRRITEAMRLVAAARVRRAQEAVLQTRPVLGQIYKSFIRIVDAIRKEEVELPILEVRDVKKVGIVLITGDRGLCGSYNSQVIKSATRRINKLKDQGIDVELILVGKKGDQWFSRRDIPIAKKLPVGNVIKSETCTELATFLIDNYLNKKFDAVEIIFTRFINLISTETAIRTILPLSLTGIENEEDECFKITTADGKMVLVKDAPPEKESLYNREITFEDGPGNILAVLLSVYFSTNIMRCMRESVASELANRMTAMQSASTNAKKIVESLNQKYNRARQASVTQEMLEIVSGANALQDK